MTLYSQVIVPWVDPGYLNPRSLNLWANKPVMIATGLPSAGLSRLLDELHDRDPDDVIYLTDHDNNLRSSTLQAVTTNTVSFRHWSQAWYVAILASVATCTLTSDPSIGHATTDHHDRLYEALIATGIYENGHDPRRGLFKHPVDILRQIGSQIESLNDHAKSEWLHQAHWESLLEILTDTASPLARPIVIHFNIEHHRIRYPSLSAEVQIGLAYAFERFASARLSGVTLRSEISGRAYHYAQRHGEAQAIDSPLVCELRWTKPALEQYIEALISEATNGTCTTFGDLLDTDRITVTERETEEDVLQYALRHVSLSPLEAERLVRQLANEREVHASQLPSEEFKKTVSDVANIHADRRLRSAAYEYLTMQRALNSPLMTGVPDETDKQIDEIRSVIESIGTETFTRADFDNATAALSVFSPKHLLDSLWLNRLVLAVGNNPLEWTAPRRLSSRLDPRKEHLAFNPILLDETRVRLTTKGRIVLDYQ